MEEENVSGTTLLVCAVVALSLMVPIGVAARQEKLVLDKWLSPGAIIPVFTPSERDWVLRGTARGVPCTIPVRHERAGSLVLTAKRPDGTLEAVWNGSGPVVPSACPSNQVILLGHDDVDRLATGSVLGKDTLTGSFVPN